MACPGARHNPVCSLAVPQPALDLRSSDQHQRDPVVFICFVKLGSVYKIQCWRNTYIDGVPEGTVCWVSGFAIFRSFGTCCKGQVLTFQKLPLISRDKNHLVQGCFLLFFSQIGGLQGRGGIAHLESLIGNLWKWLKNGIYPLLLLLLSTRPPRKGSEKEILEGWGRVQNVSSQERQKAAALLSRGLLGLSYRNVRSGRKGRGSHLGKVGQGPDQRLLSSGPSDTSLCPRK